VVTKVELELVSGQSEYSLDEATGGGILALVDYTNTTDNRQTFSVAPTADVFERRLLGSEGTTLRFSLLGTDFLVVNPTPNEDQTVDFYAVLQPADLFDDDDLDTVLPAYAHKAVEWWVCREGSEKNKDYQGISYYSNLYDKEVIKVRKRARWAAGRRLPQGRIGYPDQTNRPPADNSYDDGRNWY
jgi:hypothetical protein